MDQRPKISCYSKFVTMWGKKDLNIRTKSIKCLGNIGENWYLGTGNGLLSMNQKHKWPKEK